MTLVIVDDSRTRPEWAEALLRAILNLTNEVNAMNETLDTLVERVAAIESVGDAAIVLLGELKTALDRAIESGDWEQVQDINERLAAQTQEMAAAIVNYTPAAPAEPEAPTA